jgi:hypothetical protein
MAKDLLKVQVKENQQMKKTMKRLTSRNQSEILQKYSVMILR